MYILFTGAPGSRWSSVAEGIYRSPDIDQTDADNRNTYRNGVVKHQGAYFDPGMEFENEVTEWDKPFSGSGKRIIKSHTFAHKLNKIKKFGYPIVMVYRNDIECFKWWNDAGGFDITYPNYKNFFQNQDIMWLNIQAENRDIMRFVKDNAEKVISPVDNVDLCRALEITFPDTKGKIQNYSQKDIKVYLYK